MPFRLSILSLVGTCLVAAPPADVIARLKADVAGLSAPEMKGRGNGQEGLDRAASYAMEAFRKAGLKAEIQAVPFEKFKRERMEARLGQGKESVQLVSGRDLDLYAMELDLSIKAAPIAYVGFGLDSKDRNELAGLDLKGKVALVEWPHPKDASKVPAEARDLRATIKRLEARGAALVLFLLSKPGQGKDLPSFFNSSCPVGLIWQGCLGAEPAKLLAEAQERTKAGKVSSRELPATLDLEARIQKEACTLPNVIATVPGRDARLASEHVVLGAHLDHMGFHTKPDGSEEVLPGADDNASGCAAVLETARRMAAKPPRRSLTFLLFAGEEYGMLGSKHWVKHPTVSLDKVKSMVNLDCIGRFDASQELGLTGLGYSPEAIKHMRSLAPKKVKVATDRGASPFAYMSDHASFAEARIPAVFFFTGIHKDLHQPTDTMGKINFQAMGDITEYAIRILRDQADAEQPLVFEPIPRLGVNLDPGLKIRGVILGGCAEKLKLQPGDQLTRIGRKALKNDGDTSRILANYRVGEKVELRWTRNGVHMKGIAPLTEPIEKD